MPFGGFTAKAGDFRSQRLPASNNFDIIDIRMTDLLIRNIDPKLKRRLEARARRSGRSLSEEAKALISRAMAETQPARGLGTELVKLFRAVGPVEIEERPFQAPRRPPDFE
jgi:plasmid stability protein